MNIKYNDTMVEKIKNYVDRTEVPYIEALALDLGVTDRTITRWAQTHKPFRKWYKMLHMKQKLGLMRLSMSKKVNAGGAIFQLKANHGMIEASRVENINHNTDVNKAIDDGKLADITDAINKLTGKAESSAE